MDTQKRQAPVDALPTRPDGRPLKVALVHYWLTSMRGGEKVLEAVCELFPDADIYTHVYDPASMPAFAQPYREHGKLHTTYIHKLPFAKKHYQKYLPLMPHALEQLDLRAYDLVISFESGPAKGVLTDPAALHICYCHTPMRYIWDCYQDYLEQSGFLSRLGMRLFAGHLRLWDRVSADRVDHFVANSAYVAGRINKFYRRASAVIHPPVDVRAFSLSEDGAKEDYYVCYGQLVPYKRIDLAVQAFSRLGKRLIVIGEGEERDKLHQIAAPNVTFVGRQESAAVKHHLQHAQALIFPGKEDFGIVPVEAIACGCPVLAFGQGGALETVHEGVSGLFFYEQSVEALLACLDEFERRKAEFKPEIMHAAVQKFDRGRFLQEFNEFIIASFKK